MFCSLYKKNPSKMKNRLSICALALLIIGISSQPLNAAGKNKPTDRYLGFMAGACVPVQDFEGEACTGITYAQYYSSGLGFRTGLQYIQSIANVDQTFGIPLEFTYMTRTRDTSERLISGIFGAGYSLFESALYDDDNPFGNMLLGFLYGLFSNMEFSVGITPGFVTGGDSGVSTLYTYGNGNEYVSREWTENRTPLFMTLDAGTTLNYSIWKFDIKLLPEVHYLMTNSYIHHSEDIPSAEGPIIRNDQPVRWFFTFSAGLAFRF